MAETFPIIRQTVLDTADVRGLAEFYRELFGLRYRPGDEPGGRVDTEEDGRPDWLVLRTQDDAPLLAFQRVEDLPAPVWPDGEPPQMMHLDTTVESVEELERHRDRALALGATLLLDRSEDPDEPLYVLADPAGHPFCVFVG